jgi:polygalacturonase
MNSLHHSRRDFLKTAAALPAFSLQRGAPDPWDEVPRILTRIKEPTFPNRDFDITRFPSINDAIAAANAAGGGRVVVPKGTHATRPLRLKSRVNLHLAEGAVLKFSTDASHYLPAVFTRWEGTELMSYSPLLYAFDEQDIAITGAGTLDGQADATHWWNWTRGGAGVPGQGEARRRLMDAGARGTPVAERTFGNGSSLRPNFIQPYRCRNVFIEGITILNSPMWEIHPVLCTNVIVRGVTINTHGPNNDGCNPESCRDVLIEKCSFDTGDDCIALKSGRNNDGRRVGVPVENVVIRDCTMKDGHGGVTIGSEISGGARNVFAENCRMDSPQLDRALRLKTNSVRGGTIEKVFMRNVSVGQVREAIVAVDFNYEEGNAGSFPPIVRDIEVRNVTSRKSTYGLLLRGYANDPITNLRLIDCKFDNVERPDVLEHVKDIAFTNVSINGMILNKTVTQ